MIPGYEFGWAAGEEVIWCIHRLGVAGRMLCGRRLGHIPILQPAAPTNVHRRCLEAMYATGEQPVPPDEDGSGSCPECGGDAAVVDGVVARHGVWRIGTGGERYVSAARCPGEGARPVVKR